MGFRLNKTDYSLLTHQGDCGKIKVKNIPTDNDYKVCLAFQDKRRNILDKLFVYNKYNLYICDRKLFKLKTLRYDKQKIT